MCIPSICIMFCYCVHRHCRTVCRKTSPRLFVSITHAMLSSFATRTAIDGRIYVIYSILSPPALSRVGRSIASKRVRTYIQYIMYPTVQTSTSWAWISLCMRRMTTTTTTVTVVYLKPRIRSSTSRRTV